MRFRRKAESTDAVDEASGNDPDAGASSAEASPEGPYDIAELPDDGLTRVDLGGLVVAPGWGKDLRVQVDQGSGEVRSVVLAGKEGAVELRAYAAPRHGDLWEDIRPQIAADVAQKGGTSSEREGPFGTELVYEMQVRTAEGKTGTQTSRVIGINGPRWLLRATLLGTPAREPEGAADWEEAITNVAVRRGDHAMPVGEQLPLQMPEGTQQAD
ncbi:DUF3710 domain-containing protein [Nocardioides panacisoli]|uniref:DUF3710 domain-containing protein n=1 Tax=Nocardioides panacisoli TaxID=627624 RepID=UPI001C62DB8F|nr:DUF3710 domain-containing protein [Nocardioides panacisoli]QYJ04815.1 DUF3710 domain-containing protein [Nocardioides panacisoli]